MEHEHDFSEDLGVLDYGRWQRWGCTAEGCGAYSDVARDLLEKAVRPPDIGK